MLEVHALMTPALPLFPMVLPSLPFEERSTLPQRGGMYFALSAGGDVLYVGATYNIYRRWRRHHRSAQLQGLACASVAYYCCVVEELAETERAMIVQFMPPLNTQGPHAYMDRRCEPHDGLGDVRFTLAIPGPLCAQLDRLRTQRLAKTSRHQWVLEAIEQRIEQDAQGERVT